MQIDLGVPGVLLSVALLLVFGAVTYMWQTRRAAQTDGGYTTSIEGETETEKLPGLARWFTTVDHRDIAILYILFGVVAALWGGTDAMMVRTELITPGKTIWGTETYNGLFTTHGITMIFFFVVPVFSGIANYFLPPLIGADDMAFPRINAIAFWLLPPALVLVRGGLITEILGKVIEPLGLAAIAAPLLALEPVTTSWTMYTPLSVEQANMQVDLMLLGLHLSGLATVMASINFIVTIFAERSENVTWATLDIFSWTMLTMSGLALFAFPVLGSALIMLFLDRNFGTTFFAIDGGGPMLWQNLFWFWGHPEVYILVLPAFGLTSFILPKFTDRRLFGFKFIVYSTLAIGVLSFGVWAHHMFTTGLDPRVRASFMAVTLAIAVPSAVKVFNWMTTMWSGRIRLTAPMILIIGGIGTFVIGGVTGVFLASIPVDLVLQDTYYVVGHFHFIIMGIIAMSMVAASYYWFPILTRRMYDQRIAKVQAGLMIVGVFLTFTPMLIMGYLGLPRRYATYPQQFTLLNQIATGGAYILGTSVFLWLVNFVQSARIGPLVMDADVWNLKETGQFTREWQWFEEQLKERYDIDDQLAVQNQSPTSNE
ncbi:cbb3-type cytochrome c oxidase subunit I [Halomarina pelagica]|uniref:cbb3-type cytochrome c oxidase subunit I n=1 Tax=Halomarina pelagica TaxID=2961599 RepID=UPI0020C4202B|nr:cbb3-type cytochrome c oxidase subunit I [Halomarina sp. BND7]